ncbi:MAG: KpsF/GutQ family sugar-phosphate isomerase [Candidatus Eisenbacteria bacterium]
MGKTRQSVSELNEATAALAVARQVLKAEGEALLTLASRIGPDFEKAVELVSACKGRVVLTGVGKSGIVASKIASTLTSTGTPSFFVHPADAAHGDIGIVGKNDVVVFVSKSGETAELAQLMPVLKRLDVTLISVTARRDSPVAQASHCVIETGVAAEACPFDLVPTTSTTCALAIGDALAIALLKRKGFTREDFAFVHPGGLLGHMLNTKVEDVMHTGEALPRITEDFLMKDAILEIMKKRLGMTAVVDAEGKLSGVVTDGDIKRILIKSPDIFKVRVGDVMSTNPRTIGRDALVAAAVKRMEENRPSPITCLVVTNPSGEPEGVIHLHDCLRARTFR